MDKKVFQAGLRIQFQIRIHRSGDATQLTALIEQLKEAAQVTGCRAGLEQRHEGDGAALSVSVLCRTPNPSVAMQISYFHVPAEMPADARPEAAVVIDVLRATTTIAWALHHGAEAVQAFADLEGLRAAAEVWTTIVPNAPRALREILETLVLR